MKLAQYKNLFFKILPLTLFFFTTNCSFTKDVTSLPAKGSFIIFQDRDNLKEDNYLALDFKEDKLYRWQPKEIKNHQNILQGDYFLFGKKLLAPNGTAYSLPLPKKSRYFDVSPGGKQLAYISGNEIHITGMDGTNAFVSKYKGSRVAWLADSKLAFCYPKCASIFVMHKTEEELENPLILVTKPNIIQLSPSPNGKKLAYTTRVFRTGGFYGVIDVIKANGQNQTTLVKPDTGGDAIDPTWSIDGTKIAVRYKDQKIRNKRTPYNILIVNADGTNPIQLLKLEKRKDNYIPWGSGYTGVQSIAWSPDGKTLAFIGALKNSCRFKSEGGQMTCKYSLYTVNADGTNLKKHHKLKLANKYTKRLKWIARP